MMRYLRGRLYKAPILVYTSYRGVSRTAFVSAYTRAGSTYLRSKCLKFIDGVLRDKGTGEDDSEWVGKEETSL